MPVHIRPVLPVIGGCYTAVERILMNIISAVFIFILLFASPVLAAEPILIPPVNLEGAREIALRRDFGTVISHDIRKTGGLGALYEFNIEREIDKTHVEIEILGSTGEITSYRITRLGPNATLPAPSTPKSKAEAISIAYVDKEMAGMEKPVISDASYVLYDGGPAWRVTISKFFKTFVIYIDPYNEGDILSVKKEK